METKICTKCGKELPVDQFNWRDKNKGTRRSECKICHSSYMKNKYQEKKNIINQLKQKQSCAKCGDNRFYVLDYHHLDPNVKDMNISRMLSNRSNIKDVEQEIDKCIVLCANCHREFHYLNITIKEYLAGQHNSSARGFDP